MLLTLELAAIVQYQQLGLVRLWSSKLNLPESMLTELF
jgi:hypothetical protein